MQQGEGGGGGGGGVEGAAGAAVSLVPGEPLVAGEEDASLGLRGGVHHDLEWGPGGERITSSTIMHHWNGNQV